MQHFDYMMIVKDIKTYANKQVAGFVLNLFLPAFFGYLNGPKKFCEPPSIIRILIITLYKVV